MTSGTGDARNCGLSASMTVQLRVELNMPAPLLCSRDGIGESLARDRWIVDAGSRKVQTNPSNAGFAHRVQLGIGRLVVDHRHTTHATPKRAHAVEGARVVGPVDARLHDDDALETQRSKQLSKLLDRRNLGRVGAPPKERILLRIAENVHMAIARAGRDVEIDFCQRLRRSRGCRARTEPTRPAIPAAMPPLTTSRRVSMGGV